MNLKRLVSFIIILVLIFSINFSISGAPSLSSEIILIPLDSRPCNTDYPAYAAKAVNKNISFPKDYLDNYNKPSNLDNLYEYLYDSLAQGDTYIIYTNQIINGGLIASRDPQSYINLNEKLKEFNKFLETAKSQEKKVIVVSVLPRVIPSQFTDLWNFQEELISFSLLYGKFQINVSETSPILPPKEILARYLSIYSGSDTIISSMKTNVEQGLIDLFIIGQDDTYKESITNQQLNKYLDYNNDKIIVQPGADELTQLILARLVRSESLESPLDVKLIYTDLQEAKEIKTFESLSIEKRSKQLLNFLSININNDSDNLAIIHNKQDMAEATLENIYNNENKNYLGLIDIAYINKGDMEIFKDLHFIKNLDGYSGWNTIGNSLGTEYANLVIFDYIQKNLLAFPVEEQIKILENYYNLLYVHFADDYLYQGILRDKLNSYLIEKNENFSFILDEKAAGDFLQESFKQESLGLNSALSGLYNNFNTNFQVEHGMGNISLAWKRTFEARIVPNLKIIKDR